MARDMLAKELAKQEKVVKAIYISSYIPRECGIATFTKDLTNAINILNPHALAEIVAIDEPGGENRVYPWEVKGRLEQSSKESYEKVAEFINQSEADVVSLQHEFGLFGGKHGEFVVDFLGKIKKPVIATFHTVLSDPGEDRLRIVQGIAKNCAAIIVMVETAALTLQKVYGVPKEKIVVIHHGVPDIPYGDLDRHKQKLGLNKSTIISTFGLINPGKGVEYVIEALPEVLKKHPQVKFMILGATHPNLVKLYGEAYRESLVRLVKQLGLEDSVCFENRYLELCEIVHYLRASDIYITPYLNPQQITSGTLAYAVGAGKSCISTPYLYAKEVLGGGRGKLVPFRDSKAIAKSIISLLDNPEEKEKMEKKAYLYGRAMIWHNVALKYLNLFWILGQRGR